MPYDAVVVGAGLFGATVARALTDRGRRVLVVDRLPHTGGMCHTEWRGGILVHVYGPHVFHTNDPEIWAWVNRFSEWVPFMVRTKGVSKKTVFTLPVNLMTLHQLWGVLTPAEARRELDRRRVPIADPVTIEELALSRWGPEIYERFVAGYTRKQWGRDPKDLPAAILKRLPYRLTFDDNYFTDRYQALPVGGYAAMFDRMLDGIEVRLGVDFMEDREALLRQGTVIYSGRVDRFFGYREGALDFRTVRFDDEESQEEDLQGNPVLHWLDPDVPWTRSIEHKHFDILHARGPIGTILSREVSFECGRDDLPMYPVNDRKNQEVFGRYERLALTECHGVVFGGRLGSYRYRDMHQVIGEALRLAKTLA